MNIFFYKGKNVNGETFTGKIKAENHDMAISYLQKYNITIISMYQKKLNFTQKYYNKIQKKFLFKIKIEQLMFFCRQIYSLLKAGVPLLTALKKIKETTTNKNFTTSNR